MAQKKQSEKFIMIHIAEDSSADFLKDAIDNSEVERGLYIRSEMGKELTKEFNRVKERGYFPVGLVLDETYNMEILFKRHPKQSMDMKMVECKSDNPYTL